MAKITLLIATYNRGERIRQTLDSILDQTLAKEYWEVVVVNNNSSDDTPNVVGEFIASHPEIDIRLVDEPRQGLSFARNRGIDASTGDYIAIADDDEILDKDFLATYFDFLDTHPFVVAAGGEMIPYYVDGKPHWISRYTERPIAGTLNLGKRQRVFPKGRSFIGGNMALRRSAIDFYGRFNTELGRRGTKLLGGEEKDLFMRYYAAGEDIYYLPQAKILHIISKEKLSRKYFTSLCYRIGQSERLRTLAISKEAYRARLWSEAFKWCATLVLALFHTITLAPDRAYYLILMRAQISRGLGDSDTEKEL
ncbi:MAG: glycosyltransferase [Tidjanibacter sp.]|nr:glycosyltransferase [Tidjanibacter sp.]